MVKALFLIALLPLLTMACAGAHAGRLPTAVTQPAGKNEELLEKLQERMHDEEEAFKILSAKMDEYQNLMATCEKLADTEENREIKASCNERIKALRKELESLTDFLQDRPN